jgi:hypothetical protein
MMSIGSGLPDVLRTQESRPTSTLASRHHSSPQPVKFPESEAHQVIRFLNQNCRRQTDRDFPNRLFGIPQRLSRWK